MNTKIKGKLPDSFDKMIDPKLKNSRLIGLGEVAHGSGGLHRLSANLAKLLINRLRAETLLLEAPAEAVTRINSKIKNGDLVSPIEMEDLYFVWRSMDMLDFFNDLARINRKQKKPVQIFGIDVRQPALQIAELRRYARDSALKSNFLFTEIPESPSDFKAVEVEFAKRQRTIKDSDFKIMSDELHRLAEILEKDSSLSEDRRAFLAFSRNSVESWLGMYHHLSNDHYDEGFVSRDNGMFLSVDFYLRSRPKCPTIILAHFAHLIYRNQMVKSAHTFLANGKVLGSRLHDKLGAEYSVLALMAKQTSITGQDEKVSTFLARPYSLESNAPDGHDEVSVIASDCGPVTIGATNNETDPLKESYLEISMNPSEQFAYAVIIKEADPLRATQ